MRLRLFTSLLAVGITASSCSNDCVPVSGGVVVDVSGAPACERVTVSANDGPEYQLEASGTAVSDAGMVCVFQGLSGHPGTFMIQVYIDGAPAASQMVTLEKIDECNVTPKLVTIDVSAG